MTAVRDLGGDKGRGKGEKSVCEKLTDVGKGTVATCISLWDVQSHPGLVAQLGNAGWSEPISDRIALQDCPRSALGLESQSNYSDAGARLLLFAQSHACSDHARVRWGRGPS